VPVTKRTVSLALVASLAALVLSGCGDDQGATDTKPATQRLAEVDATPLPAHTAAAVADPAVEPAVDPATPPPAQNQIVRKTVTETRSIGYSTRTVKDSSLAKGKTRTRTSGKAGVRTLTYAVTLTNGKQTAKKLVKSVVTRAPVTKVVAVGTKQSGGSGCDPHYSGACVPIASDVDCAGGGGNGPAYVTGPVRVVGDDIYQLDRDGDGVACDD
jgi:resuscitation-promoting factor RpfB